MDNANVENLEIKEKKEIKEEIPNASGKIKVKRLDQILEMDPLLKSTNDDVQRAIKGLREIPDEELKEFLDDEDFMEGLDVVDAWERDEDKNRENEQNKNTTGSAKQGEKQLSREHRPEPKGSHTKSHKKPKKEEKKREEVRRDPLKSTKDIERDKMRTKRDTESKLLAEKEKAIKHLLDSDNVVPPGTETEAIQSIAEKQSRERAQREARNRDHRKSKSLERYGRQSPSRRRTPDRFRPSPPRRRSPFVASPDRRRSVERLKSPYKYSPSRRKNSPRYDRRSPISPDRRRSPRRLSGERRSSTDRRWSPGERLRKRRSDWTNERRRSRSRDRRSRSTERLRRRLSRSPGGRRSSRSPVSRRYSPRRRSRSRTRSRSLEKRTRKRSPFINELARQLRNEAMSTGVSTSGYVPSATMEGIAPLLNPPTFKQDVEPRPPTQPPPQPPPPPPSPYVHQTCSTPSSSTMIPPMPSGPPFINFDLMSRAATPIMNFEPMPPPSLVPTITPTSYASGPVLYNQPNAAAPPPPVICSPMLPIPTPSPQPVPPPVMDHTRMSYNSSYTVPFAQQSSVQFEPPKKPLNHLITSSTSSQSYTEQRPASSSYNEVYSPHQERVKTPEPPIISKPKQKTSLSSLLEASVSAKDSSNIPVLYPGFKPEIMRHCEQALCNLPIEDPRLKMKGRFFYDRTEENEESTKDVSEDHTSNSILLQTSKTKIFWKESNAEQPVPVPKATQTHNKICQTDEVETESKGVQVRVTMADVASQVYPDDLQQIKEEKRPILDRLDWSARDTYEYGSKYRDADDLRCRLSNSSQRRTLNRQMSPSRRSEQERHIDSMDHESRNVRLESPIRHHSRDDFAPNARDHYSRDRYSPDYHRRSTERDEYLDTRSNHSRGESPMELEDSDDELMTGHTFPRGSVEWPVGREKSLRGKSHNLRGKYIGKPYRSRGNFRG